MNERIKKIRKYFGMNQTQFGERIGVKQTTIAGYENGTRQPVAAAMTSICREFNVNKEWLENGNGEMFSLPEDEDATYVSELLEDDDNPLYDLIKVIMKTYNESGEKDKIVLKNFARDLMNNVKKESQS